MITPRVLFVGDAAAAAPWVGLAQKLARQTYEAGIISKTYAVAAGVTIRVANAPGAGICKAWVTAGGGHGFVFFPTSKENPAGIHSPRPPEENPPKLDDELYLWYRNREVGRLTVKKGTYRDYGNQFFFRGQTVYSWKFSEYGDGPTHIYGTGYVGARNNICDDPVFIDIAVTGPLTNLPTYVGNIFGKNGEPSAQVYKDGNVFIRDTKLGLTPHEIIGGFSANPVTIGGADETRYLVAVLKIGNLYWSADHKYIKGYSAKVSLLAFDATKEPLEVTDAANGRVYPDFEQSDSAHSFCLWPWRFNSTATEMVSLSLNRTYTAETDTWTYETCLVKVPITHSAGRVTVGVPIVTVDEDAVHHETIFAEAAVTYTTTGGAGGEGYHATMHGSTDTGYVSEAYRVPLAVGYDRDDQIVFAYAHYAAIDSAYHSVSDVDYLISGGEVVYAKHILSVGQGSDRPEVTLTVGEVTGVVAEQKQTVFRNEFTTDYWNLVHTYEQVDNPPIEVRVAYVNVRNPSIIWATNHNVEDAAPVRTVLVETIVDSRTASEGNWITATTTSKAVRSLNKVTGYMAGELVIDDDQDDAYDIDTSTQTAVNTMGVSQDEYEQPPDVSSGNFTREYASSYTRVFRLFAGSSRWSRGNMTCSAAIDERPLKIAHALSPPWCATVGFTSGKAAGGFPEHAFYYNGCSDGDLATVFGYTGYSGLSLSPIGLF